MRPLGPERGATGQGGTTMDGQSDAGDLSKSLCEGPREAI